MKKLPAKHQTWHIHIKGQVQGVGFRPFVYQCARTFELKGWVQNSLDGVHIEFNAEKSLAEKFYRHILSNAPSLSSITSHSLKKTSAQNYSEFNIISSEEKGETTVLVSPDFALCEDCRQEIFSNTNRRKDYAFTTCTNCGPRYSIISQLPYDRENTTMDVFKMCSACDEEYHDPLNRRYYSQTNSCEDCGIEMRLYDHQKNLVEENQEQIIIQICKFWEEGFVVAIKGVGGYLLTCDASNKKVIEKLRERKHRPTKPFALMYPDVMLLMKDVQLRKKELDELYSSVAPIVLLQLQSKIYSSLAAKQITPGLSSIGVMLPYTPLYALLMKQYNKPIIATSGNISNSPIVFRDAEAKEKLNAVADFILTHNREIVVPQDDSVVQYSARYQHRVVIRRSRGLAPLFINRKIEVPATCIFAAGAMMKGTFTFLHHENIHISQYLGGLENYDTQKNFEHTATHFFELFKTKPEVILADKHPDYFSTQLAERWSQKFQTPIIKIQHHEAHFASVLGENDLGNSSAPVLGVIWDGTGMGDDGQIWGGEFFRYAHHQFTRVNHFEYFDHFLGDKMAIEPRIAAFASCHTIEGAQEILRREFSETEWKNYQKLIRKNKLKTSSVGRIFDAVAFLLGVKETSTYEGEAAMRLQELASTYFRKNKTLPASFFQDNHVKRKIPTQLLMEQIIKAISEKQSKEKIAARFHITLVNVIEAIATKSGSKKICFSGGVFQNELLVDLVRKSLGKKFQLYFNRDLSSNDENISFGQLIHYLISCSAGKKFTDKEMKEIKMDYAEVIR